MCVLCVCFYVCVCVVEFVCVCVRSSHRPTLMNHNLEGIIPRVSQNHIYIYVLIRYFVCIYIQCLYGIFDREITKYTVIYDTYIRFWPTLQITHARY